MADEYATGGTIEGDAFPNPDSGCSLTVPAEHLRSTRDIGEITFHPERLTSTCWYCSLPPEHRGCPVHRDGDG